MLTLLKDWISKRVQNAVNVAGLAHEVRVSGDLQGRSTREHIDAGRAELKAGLEKLSAEIAALRAQLSDLDAAREADSLARRAAAERAEALAQRAEAIIYETRKRLEERIVDAETRRGIEARDLMVMLKHLSPVLSPQGIQLKTNHPIAEESDDHLFPLGAKNDNTRCPRFVHACEALFPDRRLTVLDLGCSGGGCVLDFAMRGHRSVGLEGSDVPRRSLRAEWRVIPDRLHTCDITQPFTLHDSDTPESDGPVLFDVITAWEVLEHIPAEHVPGIFSNVRRHLAPQGVFCASVATFPCTDANTGAVYHTTVQPEAWWMDRALECGFKAAPGLFTTDDFARGSGNGPSWHDWNARTQPHLGFHLVLRLA